MFVGVGDSAVMLFFKIVLRKVGIAAAAQPKLLNELFAFFVGVQLQESVTFVGRDDIGDVLGKPLPVSAVQFLQRPPHFALCFFIQFLRCRSCTRILRLLGGNRWDRDSQRKYGNEQGPYYP